MTNSRDLPTKGQQRNDSNNVRPRAVLRKVGAEEVRESPPPLAGPNVTWRAMRLFKSVGDVVECVGVRLVLAGLCW